MSAQGNRLCSSSTAEAICPYFTFFGGVVSVSVVLVSMWMCCIVLIEGGAGHQSIDQPINAPVFPCATRLPGTSSSRPRPEPESFLKLFQFFIIMYRMSVSFFILFIYK